MALRQKIGGRPKGHREATNKPVEDPPVAVAYERRSRMHLAPLLAAAAAIFSSRVANWMSVTRSGGQFSALPLAAMAGAPSMQLVVSEPPSPGGRGVGCGRPKPRGLRRVIMSLLEEWGWIAS